MVPKKPKHKSDQEKLINEAILSISDDAIIMIDKHGTISNISESAHKLFGYKNGTLLNRNIKMLMPMPDRDAHDGYVKRFLETSESNVIGKGRNIEGLHADGHIIPIYAQVSEVWDGGNPRFVGVLRDRSAEMKAKAQEDDLRTALELTSRQASLGEFATGIAHEVNQPLTAIDQYLSTLKIMLQKGGLDQDQITSLLDKSIEQCERAGSVIRSLRRFVRGGAVIRENVDMARLSQETIAVSLLESERDRVKVSVVRSDPNIVALGDRIQLQQVIHNLLRNAVDATAKIEKPKISVHLQKDSTDVLLTIRDNGHGIAPQTADQIFNRFYTSKTNGLGIGLALAKTVIEAHDGQIWLEESSDNGSIFCFKIPSAGS